LLTACRKCLAGTAVTDSAGLWASSLTVWESRLPLAFLAICAEFFGGLGLIVGFLSRIAAFGIACNMLVAVTMVHHHYGLFMDWAGNQKGEGFEFHLLAIAIAIAIMVAGAGAFSIDGYFS
jgi:putative oxidoreductase